MKIFVKTFGCTLNQGDSEVIKGILNKEGRALVNSESEADLIIVNTCGVKTPTQNRVISYLKKISKNKKVIVGGCLPSMLNIKEYVPNILGTFGPNSILKIKDFVKNTKNQAISDRKPRIKAPRLRFDKEVAIIPISQGCLGRPCSYCSVKSARGNLKSYKKSAILKEVEKSVKEGCAIIKITAQDTGCWGKDINDNLPNLLKSILKVKGNYKIRLGMMNPNYAFGYLDDLVRLYKNKKMMKFLHIPVQSGSDKVLADMKRGYKIKDFNKVVKRFRKEITGISIATDIIVGYPTESEGDFKKTLKLVKAVKPEVLNISKFAPRPNTYAATLKQLNIEEINKRSKLLFENYKKN